MSAAATFPEIGVAQVRRQWRSLRHHHLVELSVAEPLGEAKDDLHAMHHRHGAELADRRRQLDECRAELHRLRKISTLRVSEGGECGPAAPLN